MWLASLSDSDSTVDWRGEVLVCEVSQLVSVKVIQRDLWEFIDHYAVRWGRGGGHFTNFAVRIWIQKEVRRIGMSSDRRLPRHWAPERRRTWAHCVICSALHIFRSSQGWRGIHEAEHTPQIQEHIRTLLAWVERKSEKAGKSSRWFRAWPLFLNSLSSLCQKPEFVSSEDVCCPLQHRSVVRLLRLNGFKNVKFLKIKMQTEKLIIWRLCTTRMKVVSSKKEISIIKQDCLFQSSHPDW